MGLQRWVAAWMFLVSIPVIDVQAQAHGSDAPEIQRFDGPGIRVVYAAPVTEPMAERIAELVERAKVRVLAYLRQSDAYPDDRAAVPIRVLIDPDATAPSQMRSTIFIPQQRVLDFFDAAVEQDVSLAITHEVVHVLAVSAYRREQGRFFDDGLAVFLQAELDDLPAYPNFHRGLHIETAAAASRRGSLIDLDRTEESRRNPPNQQDLALAYLQEGSFAQYLIERHGLDAYLRIYYGQSPEEAVGASLESLDRDWRALIGELADRSMNGD